MGKNLKVDFSGKKLLKIMLNEKFVKNGVL